MTAERLADPDHLTETDARGAERRCIVTGEIGPKSGLIRFVVGPDQQIVPDLRGRLPGRGLWVRARREVLDLAVARRHFERAARTKLAVPPELGAEVEALLLRHLQNALGLAFKAGGVAVGYAKAEALIASGRAIGLLEASDAGPHGAAKLRARAAKAGLPVLVVLSAQEMGLALGRENMVHAALGTARLARRFLEEARRFAGFRRPSAEAAPQNQKSAAAIDGPMPEAEMSEREIPVSEVPESEVIE